MNECECKYCKEKKVSEDQELIRFATELSLYTVFEAFKDEQDAEVCDATGDAMKDEKPVT